MTKKTQLQKDFAKWYKKRFPHVWAGGFAINSLGQYKNNHIARDFDIYKAGFDKARENSVG